jgi:hypothetical protein
VDATRLLRCRAAAIVATAVQLFKFSCWSSKRFKRNKSDRLRCDGTPVAVKCASISRWACRKGRRKNPERAIMLGSTSKHARELLKRLPQRMSVVVRAKIMDKNFTGNLLRRGPPDIRRISGHSQRLAQRLAGITRYLSSQENLTFSNRKSCSTC